MKVTLTYSKDRDIWCLLNVGKSSNNSPFPTEEYKELQSTSEENPDEKDTSLFIDKYIEKNNYSIDKYISKYQVKLNNILPQFNKKAEEVFGVSLPNDITIYLTICSRCPLSVKDDWFFVSLSKKPVVEKIAMHELWHFYTFHKFGEQIGSIGNKKYNDMKEALTILINEECSDLLPEGVRDTGYPQHKELRKEILNLWNKKRDIDYLWDESLKKL